MNNKSSDLWHQSLIVALEQPTSRRRRRRRRVVVIGNLETTTSLVVCFETLNSRVARDKLI